MCVRTLCFDHAHPHFSFNCSKRARDQNKRRNIQCYIPGPMRYAINKSTRQVIQKIKYKNRTLITIKTKWNFFQKKKLSESN